MAKKHKDDYGSYILNNKESLLRRKKKILRIKQTILVLILLLTICITLGLTVPAFNISQVKVSGLENITEEEILTSANVDIGKNIFKLNTKDIKNKIVKNSYIDDVKIKRKLPNTIAIDITERKPAFYIEGADGNYIIDINGMVIGKEEDVEAIDILKVEGVPEENIVIGESIEGENNSNLEGLKDIYNFLREKNFFEEYKTLKVQVRDFVEYTLLVNETSLKLGTSDKINEKLAKGFSILIDPKFVGLKGYIDVSFEGNPVIYKDGE